MPLAQGFLNVNSIAIIGAGLAGLSAARVLADAGQKIEIFDRGSRPGGRLSSRDQRGLCFDFGAPYLCANSKRSHKLFREWEQKGWIQTWNPVSMDLPSRENLDTKDWFVGTPSMHSLTAQLGKGMTIRKKTEIVKIEGEAGALYLTTAKNESKGPFQSVLVCCHALRAAQLLDLAPGLKELAASVQEYPRFTCLVGFEEEVILEFEAATINEGLLSFASRENSKPGREDNESWVLYTSKEWSRLHQDQPPDTLLDPILKAFTSLGYQELPEITYARVHRWRCSQTETPLKLPFRFDRSTGIGIAGDWCSNGLADGAFWSGYDLAQAVIEKSAPVH